MINHPCYTEEYDVTSHNVDTNNNIKPTDLVQYMQETGNHHMRDRKPTYYDLLREGKSFVVARFAMEYIVPAHMYEHIKVHTWRSQEKGATFYRSFQVERNGEILARAYSEWAVADRNKGGLCRASEVNLGNYELGEPIELSIPIRFRFSKNIDWKEVAEEKIGYTYVDYNLHLNNTYYQDIMWNNIPNVQDKVIVASSVRFLREAPLNSKIKVYMVNQKNVKTKILDNEDDKSLETYYFHTLIGEEKNSEGIIVCKKATKEYEILL